MAVRVPGFRRQSPGGARYRPFGRQGRWRRKEAATPGMRCMRRFEPRPGSAVAARLVPLAEATDAAGSIRPPASVCGLVGLKPSRGRISHALYAGDPWYGGAYSLCHSRTVRDTAAYLDAIATGSLPGDPYHAAPPDEKWAHSMHRPPGRLNVGFATRAPDGRAFHPEVENAMRETTRLLADLGHQVAPHDWHEFNAEFAWATYLNVGAVLTAQLFESFASEVGVPVGPEDVEPITWAMMGATAPACNMRRMCSRCV